MGLLVPISCSVMQAICPCGSGHAYADCCEPLLSGQMPAATAESLMRSRYSAYVYGNYDYILATYSDEKARALTIGELREAGEDTQWLGLEVEESLEQGHRGEVRFCAYYRSGGQLYKLHEHSRFVLQDNQWRYVEGELLKDTGPVKWPRNDPCLCGSGLKFKLCCGR